EQLHIVAGRLLEPPHLRQGDIEELHNVHAQAARIREGGPRHDRPGDAALIDRGGPDRVQDAVVGEELLHFGNVTGSVDIGTISTHAFINYDPAIDLARTILDAADVRPHAGGNHDHVRPQRLAT